MDLIEIQVWIQVPDVDLTKEQLNSFEEVLKGFISARSNAELRLEGFSSNPRWVQPIRNENQIFASILAADNRYRPANNYEAELIGAIQEFILDNELRVHDIDANRIQIQGFESLGFELDDLQAKRDEIVTNLQHGLMTYNQLISVGRILPQNIIMPLIRFMVQEQEIKSRDDAILVTKVFYMPNPALEDEILRVGQGRGPLSVDDIVHHLRRDTTLTIHPNRVELALKDLAESRRVIVDEGGYRVP